MAYLKLNRETRKYEEADGFSRLIFVTPDIRQSEYISDEELSERYHQFFDGVKKLGETARKTIADYALVITPLICDSRFIEAKPEKKDNYIVTDLDDQAKHLIDDVVIKSQMSLGDDERARFGFYFAIEVSEEFSRIKELEHADPASEEYQVAVYNGGINVVGVLAEDYIDQPVRSFIPHPSVGYFEQYWDRGVKKLIDGWPLGKGYLTSPTASKQKKHIVAMNLFSSTGSEFAQYALSKDEMVALREQYMTSPWAK